MNNQCDFCSLGNPKWRYTCRSFQTGFGMSIADWAACQECYDLIEADNWDELALRASKSHPLVVSGAITFDHAYPSVIHIHMGFLVNRSDDPPVLITQEVKE